MRFKRYESKKRNKERKKSSPHEHHHERRTKSKKKLIIISLIFFIILLIVFFSENEHNRLQTSENFYNNSAKADIELSPVKTNFEEYIINHDKYVGKNVTLTGFLRHDIVGTESLGFHKYYIVDDFGNEINLSGIMTSHKKYFSEKAITTRLFEVNGKIERKYKGFELHINYIIPSQRAIQKKVIKKNVTRISREKDPINYFFEFISSLFLSVNEATDVDSIREEIDPCKEGYRLYRGECIKSIQCYDGTYHPECSFTKPYQCVNGTLVKRASICGCPFAEVPKDDECVSRYTIGPENRTLEYTLRGSTKKIEFTVYSGLNDLLASLSRSYYCDPLCPSDKEIELKYINQKEQEKFLEPLIEIIKSQSSERDDQARVAISLVQHIPYDWESFETNDISGRYPYEVLYDKKGVCEEKSKLLAFLLRELGFGVVLFDYDKESHMAVGIKCPDKYSYMNTGYCFVESTAPNIITDSNSEYIGVGKLTSTPKIIEISGGYSLESVSEEYDDAQEWNNLIELSNSSNGYLSSSNYRKWKNLVEKYGIQIKS